MQYFYDATDGLIYLDIIHEDKIPEAAVAITEAQYRSVILARSESKVIEFKDGVFTFNDKPPVYPDIPPKEEVEEALREVRTERLRQTDWTQVADSPLLKDVGVLEYRKALRDISAQEGFPYVSLPVYNKTNILV